MSKKKKLIKKLKDNWAKPKGDTGNLHLVEDYFLSKHEEDTSYVLNDRAAQDLDFSTFYNYLDRTTSAIGQQYLYAQLRDLDCRKRDLDQSEKLIEFYTKEEDKRLSTQIILNELSKPNDYYFPFLMFGKLPDKLKYFGIIKALQFIMIAGVIIGFVYPIVFIPLIIVFAVNVFLHYWHRSRIGNFANIFSRLSRLTKISRKLLMNSNKTEDEKTEILKQIKSVEKITNKVLFLKTDAMLDNEGTMALWIIMELIKSSILAEVVTFHAVVDEIIFLRKDIEGLFVFIGEIDVSISIASLRAGLPYYSKPDFLNDQKGISIDAIYHPLLKDCVENDLHLKNKSLLLTGSNMSGKTTFIRAINLNVIAAQTLNTSFTKNYKAPLLAIATSIRISDDLMEDKSYYMEEVTAIGGLIEFSKKEEPQYLFTIDEVFKGTNTIERISSAKAILEFLNQHKHLVLVSTHDVELTSMLAEDFDLYYFQESVENDTLSFDYKLKQGALEKKNAIKILEISGYPKSVTEEARRIATDLAKV